VGLGHLGGRGWRGLESYADQDRITKMLAQTLTKNYCRESDACFARPFSEDFGRSLGPDIVLRRTVVFVEIVGDG
jgi:hypothetical protein